MRLILWCAIAYGRLPKGTNHPAWRLYGGPIAQSTKRLLTLRLSGLPWAEDEPHRKDAAERLGYHASTIDTDPVRRARARTLARSRARKVGNRTPISRSWQFGSVGGMLAVPSDGHPIYALLTMAGFTLRWRLAAQNLVEAEAFVKPAVDARARVREAARAWRECLVRSPEAKTALAAVLDKQRRFRDALLAVGANRSNGWAEIVKALEKPPFDETSKSDLLKGCTRWFVELLQKNPERPPLGQPVGRLLKEADALFRVGGRGARRAAMSLRRRKRGTGIGRRLVVLGRVRSRIFSHLEASGSRGAARPAKPLEWCLKIFSHLKFILSAISECAARL